MKITREYLRTIIKEEMFKLKEMDSTILPGSEADKELTKSVRDRYNPPETEVSNIKNIEQDLLGAANNSSLSPDDLTKIAQAKGLSGDSRAVQAMNNSPAIRNSVTGNKNDPKVRLALAIKNIASVKNN